MFRAARPCLPFLVAVVAAACAADDEAEVEIDDAAVEAAPTAELSAADAQAVDGIRAVAERLSSVEMARSAGYTNQFPEGCIENEQGSQGFHFLNDALLDATIEQDRPELVMFEPQQDGSMQLIGVDYVVPFDQWTASEPPTLLGRPFMRNEALGVWALHVWTHRDNPSGMFAMFNPNASCRHAAAARM